MKNIKNFINKLSKAQKTTGFIMLLLLVVVVAIAIPTLAEPNNPEVTIPTLNIWDGTIASSYHSGDGTKDNPYIISNGSELAYLSQNLNTTDYENIYFALKNNILLNEGILKYDLVTGITYILNGITYYVDEYTADYYSNIEKDSDIIGTINIFPSLDNFKGIFLGESYTIYGSYITSNTASELGLFTNLSGTISNLQVVNSLVYGGSITGGISSDATNATLSNILYNGYVVGTDLEENIATTGGIIGKSLNTSLTNAINKSSVIGKHISGGIIGTASGTLNIQNGYNNGKIESEYISGGLIGQIENSEEAVISKSYNTGDINLDVQNGGLVGYIADNIGEIKINKSFDTTENYALGTIENSLVTINECYTVTDMPIGSGEISGTFINQNLENFYNKELMTTLGFNEFISEENVLENPDNIWMYQDNKYPVLYNDNILKPAANVYVGSYVYNSLNENLETKSFTSKITFKIDIFDNTHPLKEKYYYVSSSILTSEELKTVEWKTSDSINQITKAGNYIIYAKVVDYDEEVYYLNTDILKLQQGFGIQSNDMEGYNLNSIYPGRIINDNIDALNLNDKSIVSLNIDYHEENATELVDFNHNIVSNILLPQGTVITLYDHITNQIYKYEIKTSGDLYNYESSCEPLDTLCTKVATYPFEMFNHLGNINNDLYYTESSYFDNGTISENFTIMLDFLNTNILSNYENVEVYMEMRDSVNDLIRTTTNIKSFNIIKDSNAQVSISTDYEGGTITLNRNSYTEIDLSSEILYGYLDSKKIYDTRHDDKKLGLMIRMTNSDGNTIAKEHLDNMTIKINNTVYNADHNNLYRILLSNDINQANTVVQIETNEHNSGLSAGTYYLKISSYVSYSGLYESRISSSELIVPVVVMKETKNDTHKFDLKLNQNSYLINKSDNNFSMHFDLILEGNFENPNIRVSLYEKDEKKAEDQKHTIKDLQSYITNNLIPHGTNIYYVPTTAAKFTLELNLENFDYNGYKLIFELYDGNTLIDSVKKHFIVK